MEDNEIKKTIYILGDSKKLDYLPKYEIMSNIDILKNEGIDMEECFSTMSEEAVKKVKKIIEEMDVFDAVLAALPEGEVKSNLEHWLVNESGWYI